MVAPQFWVQTREGLYIIVAYNGNYWQATKVQTKPPRVRRLINKAVPIDNARIGDEFYFRGTMSVKLKLSNSRTFRRFRFLGDTTTVYTFRIANKETSIALRNMVRRSHETVPDDYEKALDYIAANSYVLSKESYKMESPYVSIIAGKVIRTAPCLVEEKPFNRNNHRVVFSELLNSSSSHLITRYIKKLHYTFRVGENRILNGANVLTKTIRSRSFIHIRRAKKVMRVIGKNGWRKYKPQKTAVYKYSRLSSDVATFRINYCTSGYEKKISTYGIRRC